jgi:septum formation inhibitor-activating ATPase MinD
VKGKIDEHMSKGKSKRKAWEGPTTINGKTTTRAEAYKETYEKIYGKKAPMSKIMKECKKYGEKKK